MTWFAAGAAVVGAVGGVISSGNAAKGQQKAAQDAAALQQAQYNQQRMDNMPALDARNAGLASMQDLATKYGSGVPTAASVMEQPGYQFGLQQGNANIQNSAAAAGGLYSGAVGKALAKYGTDYATSKYQQAFDNQRASQGDAFDRQRSLATGGQVGAAQIGSAGQNYANQSGQIGMQNAANQGSAGIAQWNTIQNGLNGAVSAIGQGGGSVNPYTTPGANGSYANPTSSSWFGGTGVDYSAPSYNTQPFSDARPMADGGPVRSEPKVGTRTPLRTGGGGGLSVNAIAELLAAKPDVGPDNGIQRLTANPVTKPKAIIAQQLKDAGAYKRGGRVKGPGGPRDDMIPARLSNGEHVMDAASVNALGGGSNEAGQVKLNKLRAMLKGAH